MITHVAIRDRNGKVWVLPKPNRHHNIIRLIHDEIKDREKAVNLIGYGTQGFVNDAGVFLNRLDAFHEAIKCNQVLPPYNPTNPSQRRYDLGVDKDPRELFSEDLW